MLEESIGEILTKHKAYHFTRGTYFGHLAVILTEGKYRDAIKDQTFVYVSPTDQGTYGPNAGNNMNADQWAQEETEHKRKNVSYEVYLCVVEACQDLIIYAVGDSAVAPLKERYVKYGHCSPHAMMKHLRENLCVKMTTMEKDTFKQSKYLTKWDTTECITKYWKHLDELTTKLGEHNIATSDEEKFMAAVARMWESEFFTDKNLIKWEKKEAVDQTWTNVKTYLKELYQSHKQYSKSLAKWSRFHESASNVKERENKKEENDATMMFAMMQEQHQEQLNAMRESNAEATKMANTAMAEMAKNMQIMMAAMPGMSKTEVEDDKKNDTRTKGVKLWDKPGYVKRDPKMCPNCKKVVYHKPERCLELEINKEKRRENWKSVL